MQRLARLSRLRPTQFETARHAARLRRCMSSGPGPETIRLQRVRFMKPRRSMFRRVFPWACIFYAIYASGFVGVEVVEEDEEEDEYDEEGEGEEGLSMWFIPLPFTEELHRLPEYPPGSPTRAFFGLVQHDPKLAQKLRVGISDVVCARYGADRNLVGHFGQPTGWDSWINLSYPKGPHPEWSQKGIAFGDGAIAWAMKQPVDPHVIDMLHKVLWPAPALHALWTHATTLAAGYSHRLLNSSAPPAESRSPQDVRMGQAPNEQRTQLPLPLRRQIPGGPTATPPVDSGRYTDAGTGGDARTGGLGAGGPQARAIDDSGASPELMRDLYPQAWDRLMYNLRSVWRRKPRNPPPGCVRVNGVVNVRTTKCIVHLDVNAFFNPSTNKFDTGSLSIQLRAAAPYSPKVKN